MRDIEEVLKDGIIRYAQVWEDSELLTRGLDIQPDDRVLSIGSSGDNAFALLLQEPEAVVAVDLNPAQTALIELKMAAIRNLDYDGFLSLLGLATSQPARALYDEIKGELPEYARVFWDRNPAIIDEGIVNHGRLEQYFGALVKTCFEPYVESGALDTFCKLDDPATQATRFDEIFADPKIRQTFVQYTGPERLAKEGRDPAQLKFVTMEEVGEFFFERFKTVATTIPMRGNFYMHQFFLGSYLERDTVADYLRAENYERLRSLLPRLEVLLAPIDQPVRDRPEGYFNKANLSDLFEYLSEEQTSDILGVMADRFRPQGRIAYWNLLVPRCRPESLCAKLNRLDTLAASLHKEDRAFFYRAFHLEEVVGD